MYNDKTVNGNAHVCVFFRESGATGEGVSEVLIGNGAQVHDSLSSFTLLWADCPFSVHSIHPQLLIWCVRIYWSHPAVLQYLSAFDLKMWVDKGFFYASHFWSCLLIRFFITSFGDSCGEKAVSNTTFKNESWSLNKITLWICGFSLTVFTWM